MNLAGPSTLTLFRLPMKACVAAIAVAALWAGPALRARAEGPPTSPEQIQFFETQVKPLLQANCFKCHGGGDKVKGHLLLTRREGLTQGGEHGAVLSPDKPETSLLLQMISYGDPSHQMPPTGKLKPEEIAVLDRWVKAGAPWTSGADFTNPLAVKELTQQPPLDKESLMWALHPLASPAVPQVADAGWVRNPIDAFVLAKLKAAGLNPAPPADKITLIRRATYDLTGLAPTLAEVDAFVNDSAPDAYEKVVDRLLQSPHYGETWGRHWLDLVRYAESNSYERDSFKPNVWRYRDYVIRAFNSDKPYDRFVKEQIAGDELPDGGRDGIYATGYYHLGIWDDEPSDKEQARYDVLDDVVSTTGQTFLGLTVGCARCHNHKIDPFPQKDYYKLLSFFQNISPYDNGGPNCQMAVGESDPSLEPIDHAASERLARREQLGKMFDGMMNDFRQLLSGEPGHQGITVDQSRTLLVSDGARVLGADRYQKAVQLQAELAALDKTIHTPIVALCVTERAPTPPDTFVLMRGSVHNPGDKVEPGFPQIFHTTDPTIAPAAPGARTSGRRIVLANWLASPTNPLPARVMANRIWQYHFGRGIVRTASNFGVQGDKPTHPELLDWLAAHFIANGWHMKEMHRLIMTSSAYRMSSDADAKALAADPQNDLIWRFDMRRLSAEEVRDSILALDGSLNLELYGPSVFVRLPATVLQTSSHQQDSWGQSSPQDEARRTIYVHIKRSLHVPLLDAFDAADTDTSCPVRFTTVQPTQALTTLNGQFVNEAAARLMARVRKEAGDDENAQIALAWRLATNRVPTAQQLQRAINLIDDLKHRDAATPDQAMRLYCLMVLNLDEFVFLD